MRKYLILGQILSLFCLGWFIYYLSKTTFNSQQKRVGFVYYDPIKKNHTWEYKTILFDKKKLKVKTLLEFYLRGPVDPLIKTTIPKGVFINSVIYDQKELIIDFNEAIFKLPDKNSEKIFIYSLLLTLKKNAFIIEPIEEVYFTFEGMTLPYIKGAINYQNSISIRVWNGS